MKQSFNMYDSIIFTQVQPISLFSRSEVHKNTLSIQSDKFINFDLSVKKYETGIPNVH